MVAAFYVGFFVCAIFAGRPKRTPRPQGFEMGPHTPSTCKAVLVTCTHCAQWMAVPGDSQVRAIDGVDEWYFRCLSCGAEIGLTFCAIEDEVADEREGVVA